MWLMRSDYVIEFDPVSHIIDWDSWCHGTEETSIKVPEHHGAKVHV
jgi:hypothetical protein